MVFALPTFDERQRQDQEIRLRQTDWAQPAIGALCLSHLSMLAHVGVEAHCVAGHSYGELPALFAAGVLPSTQDLLQLSRMRGELMRDTAGTIPGAMTAVMTSTDIVQELLAQGRPLWRFTLTWSA